MSRADGSCSGTIWSGPGPPSAYDDLESRYHELRRHCADLETLLQNYATVINELARENQALRGQHRSGKIMPLTRKNRS